MKKPRGLIAVLLALLAACVFVSVPALSYADENALNNFNEHSEPIELIPLASSETVIDLNDPGNAGYGSAAWSFSGSTYTIYDDVTIIGSLSGVSSTLTINIHANVTATWEASLVGSSSYSGILIALPGDGTFFVAQNGLIEHAGSGRVISATGNEAPLIVEGEVKANTGSAIVCTGQYATVTVQESGEVSSYANNNNNPVISMTSTANVYDNVFICDNAVVQTLGVGGTDTGYAIQTYGNVLVYGGDIYSKSVNGRCINLVGANSTAYIYGGKIHCDGTGANAAAISTATTDATTVPNASVYMYGGIVEATTCNAIHTTGVNAKVIVEGGIVAVLKPSTSSGSAIYAAGTNSFVEVSGDFVFARKSTISGTGAASVIRVPSAGTVSIHDPAVIVGWSGTDGATYLPGSTTDIIKSPIAATVYWHKVGSECGVEYKNGANKDFYPLPVDVEDDSDFGLIFDTGVDPTTGGKFWLDIDGDGTISAGDIEYTEQSAAWTWSAADKALTLDGFVWRTLAPHALIIVGDAGDELLIELASDSDNKFYSIYNGSDFTTGISIASPISVSVACDNAPPAQVGSLIAMGGESSTQTSVGVYGVAGSSLMFLGGCLEASGRDNALATDSFVIESTGYSWWSNANDALSPGGSGTLFGAGDAGLGVADHGDPYVLSSADKFVKLTAELFALVGDVTVAGTVNEALPTGQTATLLLCGTSLAGDVTFAGEDVGSWFINLPPGIEVYAEANGDKATGNPRCITLRFASTPTAAAEGVTTFELEVSYELLVNEINAAVLYNPLAVFDIKPAAGGDDDGDDGDDGNDEDDSDNAETPADLSTTTPSTGDKSGPTWAFVVLLFIAGCFSMRKHQAQTTV